VLIWVSATLPLRVRDTLLFVMMIRSCHCNSGRIVPASEVYDTWVMSVVHVFRRAAACYTE
jgi:hypothetical protein